MSYYIEEVCVSIFCVLILECISLRCRARHVDRSNSRGSGSKPQEQLEYSWISLVIWPTYPYISIHIHTYPYISIHIHTYPYISIHIHTYPYISIHIHTYPYIHTYPIFGGLRSNGWRLECIQPLRHAWRMQISRTTTMEMRHFMDGSGTSGVFSAWLIYTQQITIMADTYPANLPIMAYFSGRFLFPDSLDPSKWQGKFAWEWRLACVALLRSEHGRHGPRAGRKLADGLKKCPFPGLLCIVTWYDLICIFFPLPVTVWIRFWRGIENDQWTSTARPSVMIVSNCLRWVKCGQLSFRNRKKRSAESVLWVFPGVSFCQRFEACPGVGWGWMC